MKTLLASAPFAMVVAIGCSSEPTDNTNTSTYAQDVYGNYEEAAEGRIKFDVVELYDGQLADIAKQPLADVLAGVPADWIVFNAEGPKLLEVRRGPRNAAIDEWTTPPALTDFDTMGYPVADGAYRLLEVRATLDGVTSKHRALEVCWQELDHCVVVDPVVIQLDGYYQNRQRWLAEGWDPIETELEDDVADPNAIKYCRLSRYGTVSKRFYYPAKYAAGYNALGWKLYENHIGAQDISIRCYVSGTSCKAAASSYSEGSSCATFFLGWNCDCDNIDHFGYTGSTARTSAQSRCVNNNGGASISAGISGGGASFSVTWNTSSGAVYTNGGTYTDTCVWM